MVSVVPEQTAETQQETIFPGQQTDERILYIVEQHPIHKILVFFRAAVLVGLAVALLVYDPGGYFSLGAESLVELAIVSLIFLVVYLAGATSAINASKTYLTDRRVVRFDRVFPLIRNRRALAWDEVSKTKAYAPNSWLRLLRIGTVEIRAKVSADENIEINYAYYFDDLAAYIDKILHLASQKPSELLRLHEFVAKPKGRRYPYNSNKL